MNAPFLPPLKPQKVKLRVEDFALLVKAGSFVDYAKSELVEGEVFVVNAQFRPHGFAKQQLYLSFNEALKQCDNGLTAVIEFSVAIPPNDMPEPDIALTSEPIGLGPVPVETVALIVEVSDSTLQIDLGRKAVLYASAGVPEYWVADLESKHIHQMWSPSESGYLERRIISSGDGAVAETLTGLVVDTSGLGQ